MSDHKLTWCDREDGRRLFFLDESPLVDFPSPPMNVAITVIRETRNRLGCFLCEAMEIWDERLRLFTDRPTPACPDCAAKDALLERARVALDNALVWAIFATARDPKYTHPQALKNAQDDVEQIKHLLAELSQK